MTKAMHTSNTACKRTAVASHDSQQPDIETPGISTFAHLPNAAIARL